MSHLGDRLSALVDGELDGAELDRAHAHLAGCAQCRTEAAELRALKQKLRALMTGAPAEAAMTSRLVAMTGPGGPMPPRRRLLRVVPGHRPAAGRLRPGRPQAGRGWPGAAATWCWAPCPWSSAWARPRSRWAAVQTRRRGRGSPRRSRCTAWNTPSPPARSRSPVRPPSHPRPAANPAHRHREARVFTPVTRSARHYGRDGRSPLLLAAALAVAVPGFLVSACSGQGGSGVVQNTGPNDAVAAAGRAETAGKAPVTARRAGRGRGGPADGSGGPGGDRDVLPG